MTRRIRRGGATAALVLLLVLSPGCAAPSRTADRPTPQGSPTVGPSGDRVPLEDSLTWDDPTRPSTLDGQRKDFGVQFEPAVNADGQPQARLATAPADPVRAGRHAVRFGLDQGGRNRPGPRSELAHGQTLTGEHWYGFSIYLPATYARDRAADILTQWHGVGPGGEDGSPPLSIGTKDGQWNIETNPDREYSGPVLSGAYRTGGWTDWVVHVRWVSGDRGLLQVWRDGRTLLDRRDVKTSYTAEPGTYLKIGIYKYPWAQGEPSDVTRRVMLHDELRIAGADGSYAAVDPAARR